MRAQGPKCTLSALLLVVTLGASVANLSAQAAPQNKPAPPVDPTAQVKNHIFAINSRKSTPEQYLWLKSKLDPGSKSDRAAARYFRTSFSVEGMPAAATLYVAGPARIRAFLNGQLVIDATQDPKSKIMPHVAIADVRAGLHSGNNFLAIEASDFPRSGMEQFGAMMPTMVAKIVPAAENVYARPLVFSSSLWSASLDAPAGWEQPGFSDAKWQLAESLGNLFDEMPRLHWNSDAAMYRWPGYDGISAPLARLRLPAVAVTQVSEAGGHFANLDALQRMISSSKFSVTLPPVGAAQQPSLMLDFGREINGRIEFVSDSDAPIRVQSQYGESADEAVNSPYLGTNEIVIPANGSAFGPKSALRYVLLKFVSGPPELRFSAIRVDDIYYPVAYKGSFTSSDPVLNRIWEIGAYTAHLCMVDEIWDAPKRDRGMWMGDLHVSGRVIDTVFADEFLLTETMNDLVALSGKPSTRHVNTIPGYSAFWVLGEADYYRHHGDKIYLREVRAPLLGLLNYMARDLDDRHLFANTSKSWPFVDWSPDFFGDTPETRAATLFEFHAAFTDGAWLLREASDKRNAAKFEALAAQMKAAAQANLLTSPSKTFGTRWQTNAAAVFFGIADADQTAAIWQKVLAAPPAQMITPYYNFYAIKAMAAAGHRAEALDWIRKYWGGMIDEGATSFWEGYDPAWPKDNFHSHLQADDVTGYFVSLAHGWSSGPTAWLTEEILGIVPTAAGFSQVTIRPDLTGLAWAHGAEPTPNGLITVDAKNSAGFTATITLPRGISANVSVPAPLTGKTLLVNSTPVDGAPAESGARVTFPLTGPGTFQITSR
ncbi:MAG TPA: alpha-L-rhamnosidase C-terminal domain-containing protein [Candidatus Acidoferrales bacterium]|nr:alpha-L-rhamnosidase C-terminal domain-containing protein [Candidatus Acidoferrales bacterium]